MVIQTGKQHISVLNTHLQAGNKPKKQRVRMHQVEEISKLCMDRKQLMVYGGDFNIRFESKIFIHCKGEITSYKQKSNSKINN